MKSNPFMLDQFARQVIEQARTHGINPLEIAERVAFLVQDDNAREAIALQRAVQAAGQCC